MNKEYALNTDYELDVFIEEEDRLFKKIEANLSGELAYYFNRFVAVRNAIERIKYNS